jgi:hypothetical protein
MCVFFWNASVVGEIVPHASPRVIFRTDNSGMGFLYAPRRAPSADGTTLKIADREYPPESTQSDDVLAAFYATDMTVGQILSGTDLWAVERTPADIVQTAKWNVGGDVVRVNDTYELRSLSFESHFNTLWIFFGPLLPLPAHEADDKRIVTFTVAENEQANIASGALEVQRAVDAEHVL